MLYFYLSKKQFKALEILKTCVNLLLCVSSFFIEDYYRLATLILIYVSLDFALLCQLDMLIHHLLTVSLIYGNMSIAVENPVFLAGNRAIANVEISSFFLCMNTLLRESTQFANVKKANQFIFVLTFFKYRIWDYFRILIWSGKISLYPSKNPIYGLFLLNIYWSCLILRKTYQVMTDKTVVLQRYTAV
jgi:hypothetical protein